MERASSTSLTLTLQRAGYVLYGALVGIVASSLDPEGHRGV